MFHIRGDNLIFADNLLVRISHKVEKWKYLENSMNALPYPLSSNLINNKIIIFLSFQIYCLNGLLIGSLNSPKE